MKLKENDNICIYKVFNWIMVIISSNDVIIFSIHPSFFSIIDFHEYNLMSYLLYDSIP